MLQVEKSRTEPLPQLSSLAMTGCFLLSNLLLSSIHSAKVEGVANLVGGSCLAIRTAFFFFFFFVDTDILRAKDLAVESV